MSVAGIQESYDLLSARYVELLGSVEQMHELDRRRIREWALAPSLRPEDALPGAGRRFLDLGCGPGHWTDYLHRAGVDITGMDLSPEFIASARRSFPEVEYRLGDAYALEAEDDSLVGVLAWFSLIHTPPEDLPRIAAEIARVLAHGGRLLLGWFTGDEVAPFEHAVVRAWFWPQRELSAILDDAGFDVLDVEERHEAGERAVASLSAILR